MTDIFKPYKTSVMVALLPTNTYWCNIELAHVTLVYAGDVEDLRETDRNDIAKTALDIAMDFEPFTVKVTGVELFGDEEPVDVLTLDLTPELIEMRKRLVYWNASQYTDYKPHATIGPAGPYKSEAVYPESLTFDRIGFFWGENKLISDLF